MHCSAPPIKSFRNAFFSGYGQAQALTIDNISIAKPVVFSNGHLANILKYPLEQNLKKHKISKALPHDASQWQMCYNRAMNKQMSLSALSDELSQVWTKKREFLAEIGRIVPRGEWISLIRPYYYKGERGNKPYNLERMLRIYLVQNLYNLSDMATVAEVIDGRAFSDFCGVESSNQVPDGDTLGRFRNILLKNGIQQELFAQVVELLMQRGLILKRGTIVGSTFIEAPSSTKNQKKKRDPEAHSVKKGNVWHFGYKAHIGVDSESGLVHIVQVTAANVHDVCVTADLLTGEEEQVYSDSGYLGAEKRPEAMKKNTVGKKIRYKLNRRPSQREIILSVLRRKSSGASRRNPRFVPK